MTSTSEAEVVADDRTPIPTQLPGSVIGGPGDATSRGHGDRGDEADTPALLLDGVTKRFGDAVAVDDVTLRVERGEFVTLLGPSGCGKSTLLRMIGGFETPTGGRIVLAGRDVTKLPPNQRDVNMVFQDYALFPHLSVLRNVAYGLRRSGVGRSRAARQAREALELVELDHRSDAAPHELSGGQRQRVALARALVRQPAILLLDEPLSALDAKLREQMQVELSSLHEKVGTTFVLVTHDQSEALSMSDRVAVMDAGRIVECSTPHDLYRKPATRYAASFVGSMNFFASPVHLEQGRAVATCHGQPVPVPVPVAGDEARDQPVQFGFRPESAKLVEAPDRASEGSAATGILRGTVADVRYRGADTIVTVDLGPGTILVAVDDRSPAAVPDRGDTVGVTTGAILVFPEAS